MSVCIIVRYLHYFIDLAGRVIGITTQPLHMDRVLTMQPLNLVIYHETERPEVHMAKLCLSSDVIDP